MSHVKSITCMRSSFLRPIAFISKTRPQEQKARPDVIIRSQESILGYKSNYPTESDDIRA